jgi:tetratricopeptide (TPR) repeat protein
MHPHTDHNANNNQNMSPLLRQAEQALHRANYNSAERLARAVLADAPTDPTAACLLAEALAKSGRQEEAIVALRSTVTSNPLLFRPRYRLAHLLLDAGDPERSLLALQDLLAIKPRPIYDAKDVRLVDNAYALYLKLQEAVANRRHAQVDAAIAQLRASVEALSGCSVIHSAEAIPPNANKVDTLGTLGNGQFTIHYSDRLPVHVVSSLLAQSLAAIKLEVETIKAGRMKHPTATDATAQFLMSFYAEHLRDRGTPAPGDYRRFADIIRDARAFSLVLSSRPT